ncbi:hypothetical protein ACFO0N_20270 [Halobium salinum]|uniref:Uncharacterized protein n=1 Tax=Halobium salinum TaxID=1364940 RepID=A0ABD5PIK6_9EURY|nr:hypothetical protein [Halobium salinum]
MDFVQTDEGYIALQTSEPTSTHEPPDSTGDVCIRLVEVGACGDVVGQITVGWDGSQHPHAFARSNDGYIVAGTTHREEDTNDRQSGFVAEISPGGDVQWCIEAGSRLQDVVTVLSGEYVAVGSGGDVNEPGPGENGLAVRFDAGGEVDSVREYPRERPNINGQRFYSVAPMEDGGVVAAGQQSRGIWVLAVSPTGGERWSAGLEVDEGQIRDIVRTTDGGYALVGYAFFSEGGYGSGWGIGPFLWKLDGSGSTQWVTRFSDPPYARAVVETEAGYAVTGEEFSVLGTTAQGTPQWLVPRTEGIGRTLLARSDGSLVAGGFNRGSGELLEVPASKL